MSDYKMPFNYLLNPGHTACSGCGEVLAMRQVLQAVGPDTIIANATGCSEVTTSLYPNSSFKVPWIHANFENASAVASGILAAGLFLRRRRDREGQGSAGKDGQNSVLSVPPLDKPEGHGLPQVMAWGGDGATFDIGLGLLSGIWERGENILYVCFDNEAYMNTGIQASGATPFDANTTTTPVGRVSFGNRLRKKDMVAIALAHQCVYVATATVANVVDIVNKVKKALNFTGPKYIQILTSCVPGWKIEERYSIKVARLAQQTGVYPVVEYENGRLINAAKCPKPRPRVEEYLKLQGRFKHLFKNQPQTEEIAKIQAIADENVKKFGL